MKICIIIFPIIYLYNITKNHYLYSLEILSTITNGQFVVISFTKSHVLCTSNILCSMYKILIDKNATLEKSAKLMNNVIKSIEDSRTSESFSNMWTSIQTFAKEKHLP